MQEKNEEKNKTCQVGWWLIGSRIKVYYIIHS